MTSLDTLLSPRRLFGQRIMKRWTIQKPPGLLRRIHPIFELLSTTDRLTPIDPQVYLRKRGTIHEDLNQLPKPIDYKKTIYMMHSPPFGTKLDLIQGGNPAGSRSIKSLYRRKSAFLNPPWSYS